MSSTPHEITLTTRARLSTHARLQWDSVREKQVILMPEGVLALNPTAASIMTLCDGQRSVSDIVTALREQYNHVGEQDVLTFLNRLAHRSLLDVTEQGE